ncbi:MAG TPA: DUF3179 domain-containing protein [Geminicoccaceae bacterium]|jgi:hypothetical protein|nr:DUF3179 domain-containing protein [Geminicoccaceae bacterium]
MRRFLWSFLICALAPLPLGAEPAQWRLEWPETDFTKHSVAFDEIMSGGPPKDGIPSIDDPAFVPVAEADLPDTEPVIGLIIEGEAKAYPLRILIWHEIVNDVVGGMPVAITYCPLCNTGIVFDRRIGDRTLEFGTTGKLRNSDLVMYDRTTESWWQQFLGEAIVGELTGAELAMLPSRLESFANFKERAPEGRVQVTGGGLTRAYGANPYAGYDSAPAPFLYHGPLPEDIAPLARVVRVGDQAWSLDLVRDKAPFEVGDLRFTWEPGQTSALDSDTIAEGVDVGNVLVERRTADGWEDAVYSVDFAFAFHAFYPEGAIHVE